LRIAFAFGGTATNCDSAVDEAARQDLFRRES